MLHWVVLLNGQICNFGDLYSASKKGAWCKVLTKWLQEAAVCGERYSPTSVNSVTAYVTPYAMKYLMVCLATCGDFYTETFLVG